VREHDIKAINVARNPWVEGTGCGGVCAEDAGGGVLSEGRGDVVTILAARVAAHLGDDHPIKSISARRVRIRKRFAAVVGAHGAPDA
jgi:hypothetical protein